MRTYPSILILLLLVTQQLSVHGFTDSSSAVAKRIHSISSVIPLHYDQQTHQFIRSYRNDKEKTAEIIGRAAYYLPRVENILEEYGLPADLQYLPLAASGFDHLKVSKNGGSGFWQMGYRIAMRQELYVSTFVDERRDWVKATHAAAKELKSLHGIFDDWSLAIAAFYSDKTDVQIAIKMSKGSFDYHQIKQHLPEEAAQIVAAFSAAKYLMHFFSEEKFGVKTFEWPETSVFLPTDWLSFSQLEIATGMEVAELQRLNPIFKKKVVPHASRQYEILIPKKVSTALLELGDSLYRIEPGDYMAEGEQPEQISPPFSKPKVTPDPREQAEAPGNASVVAIYYTVRSGEFLGLIADIHDVNISDVRLWNGIRGDRINAGQQLKIMVPGSKVAYYKSMNTKSAAEKRQIANGD